MVDAALPQPIADDAQQPDIVVRANVPAPASEPKNPIKALRDDIKQVGREIRADAKETKEGIVNALNHGGVTVDQLTDYVAGLSDRSGGRLDGLDGKPGDGQVDLNARLQGPNTINMVRDKLTKAGVPPAEIEERLTQKGGPFADIMGDPLDVSSLRTTPESRAELRESISDRFDKNKDDLITKQEWNAAEKEAKHPFAGIDLGGAFKKMGMKHDGNTNPSLPSGPAPGRNDAPPTPDGPTPPR